jgi:hypothetical protein
MEGGITDLAARRARREIFLNTSLIGLAFLARLVSFISI